MREPIETVAAPSERPGGDAWLGDALSSFERLANVGFLEVDLATGMVRCTAGTLHLLGADSVGDDAIRLESLFPSLHPDDASELLRTLSEVGVRGGNHCVELRRMMPDGSIRYLECRGESVGSHANGEARVRATLRDVGERHALRVALREREKETRLLYTVMRETEPSDRSIEEVFRVIVGALPSAWLHATHARARIRFQGMNDDSPGFVETPWMQRAGFRVQNDEGEVMVAYDRSFPTEDDGPFLHEERDLLVAVADRLGRFVSARRNADLLRKLSAAVEQSEEAIVITDVDANIEYVNPRFERSTGYDRTSVLGRNPRFLQSGRTPRSTYVEMWAELRAGRPWRGELSNRRRDGTSLVESTTITPIHDPFGRTTHYVAIKRDVTERKRAEAVMQRMNRVLRTIGDCHEAIARAPNEQALLDDVCRIAVESGGYCMAFVGYAEDDAEKTVRPVAWSTTGHAYISSIRLSWGDGPLARGPTGRSIREQRPVIFQHLKTDPAFDPWREAANRMGFESSSGFPLIEDGRSFGALMVYAPEPDAFDADEVALLERLATNLSFGIRALRDRAEREKATRELHATASELARVLEASPVLVFSVKMHGTDIVEGTISENLARILGYTRDDVLGPGWLLDHVHPEDRQSVIDVLFQVVSEQRATNEFRFADATGRYVWIQNDIRLLSASADGVFEIAGVWVDVSARREAEAEIRKLSQAIEQSPESIVITDLAGRIEYVNPSFLATTGYAREEILGNTSRLLQSGKTPSSTYQDMWSTLSRGEPWKGEFINRRKDGSEYVEFATIAPIRQPGGPITHFLAVKEDVTEKQRMSAELDEYRRHLEDLVERRTAELADARIRAETANVAKSAFLANMSHEIRTPLNAILGLTHLLRQGPPSPERGERLAKIDAAGRHLLSLIDDILDLSKIEAGKMVAERVDFELAKVVHEVCEILRPRAEEKHLSIAVVADPRIPASLEGDPLRVRQILLNLGANAVKFTERGSVMLSMALLRETDQEVEVRFELVDTGVGIDESQRARLFQPFQQADGSTTRKFGGSGLGLAICRRLVELMGGQIGVESEPGRGSTFWFSVPFGRGQGVHHSMRVPTPLPEEPDARTAAPLRILLVEDDPINQEVGRELLRTVGHEVELAVDGARAIDLARAHRYDVVLMDVQMPVMDGFAATTVLRSMPEYVTTPIIALTANAFQEDRDRCLAAGMDDVLTKPVEPSRLYSVVTRWAARGSRPVPAAAPFETPSRSNDASSGEALDLAVGLHLVGGDSEIYAHLLQTFVAAHGDAVARLRQHLERGARADAQRIAHTLKGSAGSLGARRVQSTAAAVEETLRGGGWPTAELEAQVLQLEHAMRAMLDAIRERLAS